MKILAVIIAHPLRKIAGATNAGRELSIATAKHVDMELAIMWDRDERMRIGCLNVRHMRATNPLQAWEKSLPRMVTVPLYGSKIPELIEGGDYDLVHLHNLLPAFAAEQVARACQRRGLPYVISSHGFNEQSRYAALNGFRGPKRMLARWAIEAPFERVIRGAAGIFALSDREERLMAQLGVPPDRVHVVTNGVNEYYLDEPSETELREVQTKFHLGSEPMLLFMGSLRGYKGLDVFLAALKQVTGPFRAMVAGSFRSDQEKHAVLAQAGLPTELARRVVFTNAVTDAELRALYHSAALFVYPTKGDTLPLVVLEAMASGLPVISTTVGGIPFMVGPEQGVLIPPNQPWAVADAINSLIADPARREAMSRCAKDNVRARFRWSLAAEAAVAGYHKVLQASNMATAHYARPMT